eukprot:gene10931-11014_t
MWGLINNGNGKIDPRFGFAPTPGNKSMIAGGAFFVNKQSKHVKEDFTYVQYLLQKDNQIKMVQQGLCSPLKSAYDAPEVQKIPYVPALKISLDRAEYMLEAGPDADLINNVITTYIQKIWNNEISVEDGLKKAKDEIEKGLGKNLSVLILPAVLGNISIAFICKLLIGDSVFFADIVQKGVSKYPVKMSTLLINPKYAENVVFTAGMEDFGWQLTLSPDSGNVTAIMGPSGAGKSTLLKLLLGIEKPQTGTIVMQPANPVIAYVPQEPVLFEHLSVKDNARYFSFAGAYKNRFDEKLYEELIFSLDLQDVIDRSKNVTELSGDAEVKRSFLNKLREITIKLNLAVLYITHHKLEAQLIADDIVYLTPNKIKDCITEPIIGSIQQFLQAPPILEAANVFRFPDVKILPVTKDENGNTKIANFKDATQVASLSPIFGVLKHDSSETEWLVPFALVSGLVLDEIDAFFAEPFVLIHSAGDFWDHVPFLSVDTKRAKDMMDSHYGTLYNVLQSVLPMMENGATVKLQALYGIELAKKLRRADINLPIIFASIFSRKQAYANKLDRGIINSIGHGFIQLPFSNEQLLEVSSMVKQLNDLELYDIVHNYCSLPGMVKMLLHSLTGLQSSGLESDEEKEIIKGKINNAIIQIYSLFSQKSGQVLHEFNIRFPSLTRENINEAIRFVENIGTELMETYAPSERSGSLVKAKGNWALLLLDDEITNSHTIVKKLEERDVRVFCAQTAEEAQSFLISKNKIVLVLSDYRLEVEVDGLKIHQLVQGYQFLKELSIDRPNMGNENMEAIIRLPRITSDTWEFFEPYYRHHRNSFNYQSGEDYVNLRSKLYCEEKQWLIYQMNIRDIEVTEEQESALLRLISDNLENWLNIQGVLDENQLMVTKSIKKDAKITIGNIDIFFREIAQKVIQVIPEYQKKEFPGTAAIFYAEKSAQHHYTSKNEWAEALLKFHGDIVGKWSSYGVLEYDERKGNKKQAGMNKDDY